ncbi:MAG: hypothetical protein F6J93_03675 [Oscillatoria sp. SIO1A7]|nr:hypothetical protein [Oscillatoria sp. SIO1A7]
MDNFNIDSDKGCLIMAISPHKELLKRHGRKIAAFSWLAYQDRGEGAVRIKILDKPNRISFNWIPEWDASSALKKEIKKCDFTRSAIALFPGKTIVRFCDIFTPLECYSIFKNKMIMRDGSVEWRLT